MLKTMKNAFAVKEIRQKILFTLGVLIVFRLGTYITVPGINAKALQSVASSGLISILNTFSGGGLTNYSILAMGVSPYITAQIVIQLLQMDIVPRFVELGKQGEVGRRKLNQYTRYLTIVLAFIQSIGITAGFNYMSSLNLVQHPGVKTYISIGIILTGGTMFTTWLGDMITERGLGNGISIIIFAGIVAGLPNAVTGLMQLVSTGAINPLAAIFVIAVVLAVTAFVVFMERGQRRITVNYARRQVGRRIMGGQSTYLPLKINMANVIPPIFASSLILFPATLASWFTSGDSTRWIRDLAASLSPGQPLYTLLYAALIVFFAYFYTALVFNPKETADNLKKGGAFIPGIRPGDQTAKYIDRVLQRLTLSGAIYLVFVCLVPEFLNLKFNVPFYFGGTSLLIVVVVAMDFMSQVQAYLMSHQYESLLRKTNFQGFGRGM